MRLTIMLAMAIAAASTSACAKDLPVPFVGCRSDGQTGPLAAPRNDDHAPKVPAQLAPRLAWYASNTTGGVLAPRGWRCFELYGSNGSVLMLSPSGLGADPFSAKLIGPAIQVSISLGDTSGRFEAARIAARVFPERKAFVESVMAEGIAPRSQFPFGPYPYDSIQRFNRDYVTFETPAHREGLGTMTRLRPSADPIRGLVWMDTDNNATVLAVRLAPAQRNLSDYIIRAMTPR
ncbi:hypothetical protein [Novosphingobium sp. B-7]|uniref:hypothetical protein n=1 Tax=Novosphingobium sp. B-7 TaxID=1298855 RepID=UPI00042351A6|nr:hypothetical protein [Novosphingobium sp. B-7]